MKHMFALASFLALAAICHADVTVEDQFKVEEDSVARVLAQKLIQNKYLVEGQDVVVRYSLFNIGASAAINVRVQEAGFGAGDFDLVAGKPDFTLDRLAPGANVTHTLVVRPLKYGYYNFTAATFSYLESETATEPTIGYTSEPGEGGIVAYSDFHKKFSSHLLDWIVFAVMTLPSLGIPFALWFSSKSKYDAVVAEKRADANKKRE